VAPGNERSIRVDIRIRIAPDHILARGQLDVRQFLSAMAKDDLGLGSAHKCVNPFLISSAEDASTDGREIKFIWGSAQQSCEHTWIQTGFPGTETPIPEP
jgi:hypothetical protein